MSLWFETDSDSSTESKGSSGSSKPTSRWDLQERDNPFNMATSVTLNSGERSETTLEPESRISQYFLTALAVSKHPDSTYRVETDRTDAYDDSPVPPTDIDDDAITFNPPETFEDQATVIIENLSASTRTYYIQAKGWERRKYSDEGGL